MPIYIGQDPNWRAQQQAQQRAQIHDLMNLVLHREEEKRRRGESALDVLAAIPGGATGPLGDAFRSEFSSDPLMMGALGSLGESDRAWEALMRNSTEASRQYGTAVKEAGDYRTAAAESAMSIPPGGMAAGFPVVPDPTPVLAAAAAASSRNLMGRDPSGMREGFSALDPRQQGLVQARAARYNFPQTRLVRDTLEYSEMGKDNATMYAATERGDISPDDYARYLYSSRGMAPRPGVMAEEALKSGLRREEEDLRQENREALEVKRQTNRMAIERFRQSKKAGDLPKKADIVSEIMAGNPPMTTKTDDDGVTKVLPPDMQPPEFIPRDLATGMAVKMVNILGMSADLPDEFVSMYAEDLSADGVREQYLLALEAAKGDKAKARALVNLHYDSLRELAEAAKKKSKQR